MKIDKELYNWFGFNHDEVNRQFEGDLTYIGTFCIGENYQPYAVYHNANPNRDKNHKDYFLLTKYYFSGINKEEMEKERYQNAIVCKECDNLIYSVMRHDCRCCECGNCSIDGGKNYTSINGDPDKYELVTIDLLTGAVNNEEEK